MLRLQDQISKESVETIDVKLSYKIIELFSDGLYSSPNKAVEELVSNSFDAGATLVHVMMTEDRTRENPNARIMVVDNGSGMNDSDLKNHWMIGVSNKRKDLTKSPHGRKQIGKFGIGKLATYVLAKNLTHVTKKDGKFYFTSMDYSKVPQDDDAGVFSGDQLNLPLHTLTESEAQELLKSLLTGKNRIKLFGNDAEKSWTVVIMHNLKSMASSIQTNKLKWILSTALPLRDDFKLYFNDEQIKSSKLNFKPIQRWVIGRDYKKENIKKPADEKWFQDIDDTETKDETKKFALRNEEFGLVHGYFEIFDESLTQSKSDKIERSNGFFVYVHDRLINIDDDHFGIDANQLRHGTLSRFRAVIHIDGLDKELRSSRETVREGVVYSRVQDLLKAIFNHASAALNKHTDNTKEGKLSSSRIGTSPSSLTKIPILGTLTSYASGKFKPLYIDLQGIVLDSEKIKQLSIDFDEHSLVQHTVLSEVSQSDVVAKYRVVDKTLVINTLHPFIAYFMNEMSESQVPFELISMLEILTEAYLVEQGMGEKSIHEIMKKRDLALRHFSQSSGKKTSHTIAQELLDSATDKKKLEEMLVSAFSMLGFDAVPLGGSGKPDGIAVAHLPAATDGKHQKYSVSLEAKSKEKVGATVSSKTVSVSTIARHRKDFSCDHSVVVGPEFPEIKNEDSAVLKEIQADFALTSKTITLVRVSDLAKLVRIAPLKGIGLDKLRDWLINCASATESAAWIKNIEETKPEEKPYKEILEAIWELQKDRHFETVEYGSVSIALQTKHVIKLPKAEIKTICEYLSKIANGLVFAWDNYVELRQKPEHIINMCKKEISQYKGSERANIFKLEPDKEAETSQK